MKLSGLVPGVITEWTVVLNLSCSQAGGGWTVAVMGGGWELVFPPFLWVTLLPAFPAVEMDLLETEKMCRCEHQDPPSRGGWRNLCVVPGLKTRVVSLFHVPRREASAKHIFRGQNHALWHGCVLWGKRHLGGGRPESSPSPSYSCFVTFIQS